MKLPLLVVVAWTALRSLPADDRGLPRPGAPLLREAALLGGAVCALMLAVALLVVAVVAGWGWARLGTSAAVVAMIGGRAFGPVLVALLTAGFTIGLVAFLLPFYVADVLHGSPELTGTALLFFAGAMSPVSPVAGVLADRFGTRVVALTGSTITIAALATMTGLDAGAGLGDPAWRLALLGVGAGLFNPAINAATLAAAPPGMEGTAGGIAMTARTVATTVAPGIAALCWVLAGGGVAGFRYGVLVLGAVTAVGLLALLMAPRRRAVVAGGLSGPAAG